MDSEDAMAKVKEVSEGVREAARTVRQSLEQGQAPGQALGFLRDVVRESNFPQTAAPPQGRTLSGTVVPCDDGSPS